MNDIFTRTFYTVESFGWYDPGSGQSPYWRASGSGPGGPTIEDAHKSIKKDLQRFSKNGCDLSKVKIKIKKIVTIESVEEQLTGDDFTAFILKTD